VEDGPNLFIVSEKGWDEGSLDLEFFPLEIPVGVFGYDRTSSDHLLVVRGVLTHPCNGVVFPSEFGVIILIVGEWLVSDYVNEENSQNASNAGQEGLHLFKSLGG
jgi:hypothetical protein